VVEEHGGEVRTVDVEVQILHGKFLRDDEGQDGGLECDQGEVNGNGAYEERPVCPGRDCLCIFKI